MADAWVVLTAAGAGSRLGGEVPKALVQVSGRTILELALERILKTEDLAGIVITCPAGYQDQFLTLAQLGSAGPEVRVVPGGASRQGSVLAGLKEVQRVAERSLEDSTPILVHDAARCLTPTELFDKLIELVRAGNSAVIPVLPVTDTTVRVDADTGMVVEELDRASLAAVQTPQAFRWDALLEAHDTAAELAKQESTAATDDATLVRRAGYPVSTTLGSELGFKVTLPQDIEFAESLLA